MRALVLSVLVSSVLVPVHADAQSDSSHWGVVASFTPSQSWNTIAGLDEYVFEHEGSARIAGTDFSIGIARGRWLGGDWGVSYVRRSVEDGSRFERTTELCMDGECQEVLDEYYLARGMSVSGVEAHKYINFVTIARRAQVGLNVAGGIGAFSGEVEKHAFEREFEFVNNQVVFVEREVVTVQPAKDLQGISPFPLGKVEIAASALVLPGLKIRASGGFNFPGYTLFRLTGVYLFGAD